jgi:uncharacterized RDD family membrane protein YckC
MNQHQEETPSTDDPRQPVSPPIALRSLAAILDLAIITIVVLTLSVGPWQLSRAYLPGGMGIGFLNPKWLLPIPLIILLTPLVYYTVPGGRNGSTPGRRICGMNVVAKSEGAIGYIRAAARYVGSCFVAACVAIGVLIATTSADYSLESEPATSVSNEPALVVQGTWEFDAETMRTTSQYKEQIALAQSRGDSHEEAVERAERILATFAEQTYSISERAIELSNGRQSMTADYHIATVNGARIVIVTTKDDGSETRTAMQIIDDDHIAIADDREPDTPYWIFRRVDD